VQEADEEMALHMEMWRAEYRARGLSDADASAAAAGRFGDPDDFRRYSTGRAARQARWHRVIEWCRDWGQDVRFAIRQARRTPLFAAGTVATLALGIGANTAIFSVVHHLLLSPLPYRNGDRVVALRVRSSGGFAGLASMAGRDRPANPPEPLLTAWAERSTSFEAIAGAEPMLLAIDRHGRQDTLSHVFITTTFLSLLGVRPALGRGFLPDEDQPGRDRVAMISHGWWQRAYGGQDDVLGRTIEYEGNPYTIVGVMPPRFELPMRQRRLDELSMTSVDMWMPAPLESTSLSFGLLRSGVPVDAATRDLQAIANTVRIRNSPDTLRAWVMRPQDFLASRAITTVQMLFVAVGLLLVIACANAANLLLARAWTRRREFAVRMGLGAGRARLVRLALTESVMLALVAGLAGIAVAWGALRVIVAMRPIALDGLGTISIDPVVMFWTTLVSVTTGILFGSATASFVGSCNVGDLLRGDTRTASEPRFTRRVRSSLIVGEIALSLILLVGAGLLTRSFLELNRTRLGFDPDGLVSIDVVIPPVIRRNGEAASIQAAVVDRLAHVPGVLDVAVGTLPTAGWRVPGTLSVESAAGEQNIGVTDFQTTWMDTGYFRTSRIGLLAGRLPDEQPSDMATTPPFRLSQEIVVNRALARRIVADGNVLGMRLRSTGPRLEPIPSSNAWSTIVGISDDVVLPGIRGDLESYQLYSMPLARMPNAIYVVRMNDVPEDVESVFRAAIQEVNPTLIARRARLAEHYVREALAPTRFALGILGAFAFVALALSIAGLYGAIAYAVSHRTRELGIRIALGASRGGVMQLLIRDGIRVMVVGVVIGLVAAAVMSQAMSSLLVGIAPHDPATFVVTALVVAVTTLVASYVPARRALRIDPVEALRLE
jgi:predicted permease